MIKKCLVLGGSGFIGSHLVKRLVSKGHEVTSVDLHEPKYTELDDSFKFIIGDLRERDFVSMVIKDGIDEVYQLAADMGGAGYINTGDNDADVVRNSMLINLNVVHECTIKKVKKVFFSSSACVYNEHNQEDPLNPVCVESSVYPAYPDTEYGWEKLFSERLYTTYKRLKNIEVRIARFHNVFGPEGTYDGGKEKVPAALCRKVLEKYSGDIEVWGDGQQTRSFLYIDDCIDAVELLMESNYSEPINIGSEELISINKLAEMVIKISQRPLKVKNIEGPTGVRGRKSDNKLIREVLGWEPKVPLSQGMRKTLEWIRSKMYMENPKNPILCNGFIDEKYGVVPLGNPIDGENKFGFLLTGGAGHKYGEIIDEILKPLPECANYREIESIKRGTKYLTVLNILFPAYFINNVEGFRVLGNRIVEDLQKGLTRVIIVHDTEGLSGTDIFKNDYSIIHNWALDIGINPEDVTFIHGNIIGHKSAFEQNSKINIIGHCVFEGYDRVCDLYFNSNDILKYEPNWNSPKIYLNLNRNPRRHRVIMLCELMGNDLFRKGINSFNFFGEDYSEWVKNNITRHKFLSEEQKNKYSNSAKFIYDLSPQKIDFDVSRPDLHHIMPLEAMEKCFLYLVTETLVDEKTLFITEKTFKGFAIGVPMIIYGSPKTLEELRRMGYQTFSKWWDESYDEEIDQIKRLEMIVKILKDFSSKTSDELKLIRDDMQSTLRYNRLNYFNNIYMNHTNRSVVPTYNKGEDHINHYFMTQKVINDVWEDLIKENE